MHQQVIDLHINKPRDVTTAHTKCAADVLALSQQSARGHHNCFTSPKINTTHTLMSGRSCHAVDTTGSAQIRGPRAHNHSASATRPSVVAVATATVLQHLNTIKSTAKPMFDSNEMRRTHRPEVHCSLAARSARPHRSFNRGLSNTASAPPNSLTILVNSNAHCWIIVTLSASLDER